MRTILYAAAYLMLAVSATGCGRPAVGKANATYNRLAWIGEAYMKATDDLGQAPTKVEDLTPYLEKRGNVAEILRSDDDKEEFVILWNVDYRVYDSEHMRYPVTAYEKKGRSGTRFVLNVRLVSKMSDAVFKEAPFPPGQKAPD